MTIFSPDKEVNEIARISTFFGDFDPFRVGISTFHMKSFW